MTATQLRPPVTPAVTGTGTSADPVAHLTPERMARAQHDQVAKMLGELAHECLVEPREDAGRWLVAGDDPSVVWEFAARRLPLDHWQVDPASVRRTVDGAGSPVDAQQLVLDLQRRLGLSEAVLPTYLEEIAATLAGRAWKLRPEAPSSAELADAGFQQLEGAMTEGHPCFLANNGRIGFGVDDYHAYAPETAPRVHLEWVAVRAEHAVYAGVAGLEDQRVLLADQLDPDELAAFERVLRARGVEPGDYLLVPCHPWQWRNKLAVTFAPQLATGDLVHLGTGRDAFQPQQSLRTFFDLDRPERHYVKTALSVLNMGFMRGLSAAYMAVTPAINTWVDDLVAGDEELRSLGFSVLREVAAVGYRHPVHEQHGPSPYQKMLAALWRESPVTRVARDERLMTMAGLLHVDAQRRSLAAELVDRSGLEPRAWLATYLRAYLRPVLHCFYAHRLVFMPHGENLILVLRDHVPVRALMKDIGEEVGLFDLESELPEEVRRIRADLPEHRQVLAIASDVLDCYLRFLAAALDDAGTLPAAAFWAEVAACVAGYQADHPELAERFAAHDLFAPTFERMCMNRLQLRDNQQMVDIADPSSAFELADPLPNPLSAHRPVTG
ncbi:IucA/IucC family siderophore biosynthesis protein [Nocardioides sp. ChNu-153]|uniref:IucA/IucC family protein n=1 Tax=unclassified Nocardioides TaxID=2615069 RepID=UPI0024069780|nr:MULTISPECIES: IucA/IucC family siderophore biosynthesis protein [unclassified Nocardioides]MDF9715840.1 IucA/IucC family siderophore biosynthesis protein [Nocardioides sp. ChNu-99]MDN7120780.1 IucA/IucC family siderophore biosynthesis protein [Nocardioides sp. ChNu-153]